MATLMVGNIGGHLYLNISILASLFRVLGRGRQDLLNALEATLYMRLPDEMEIPCFPISPGILLSSLFNTMRIHIKQRQGERMLASHIEQNPAWFRQTQEGILETASQVDGGKGIVEILRTG